MSGLNERPHAMRENALHARTNGTLQRPRTLALFSVAVIGLLALLYLNQVASVTVASAQLSTLNAEHASLERQQSAQEETLGKVTSPAYVDQRARAAGFAPNAPGSAVVITVAPGSGGH